MSKYKTIEKALTRASIVMAERASDEAPVDTGDLASSIFASPVTVSNSGYEAIIGVNPTHLRGQVNYAPFVHFGTGIHGIQHKAIKAAKHKAFFSKKYGFFTSNKGIKPNPFMERAFENYSKDVLDEFSNAVDAEDLLDFEGVQWD